MLLLNLESSAFFNAGTRNETIHEETATNTANPGNNAFYGRRRYNYCHFFSNYGYCKFEEETGYKCKFDHIEAPICSFDGRCNRMKCMFSHKKRNNNGQHNYNNSGQQNYNNSGQQNYNSNPSNQFYDANEAPFLGVGQMMQMMHQMQNQARWGKGNQWN